MIKDVIDEYRRYKIIGQKALDQLSEGDINRAFGEGTNSAAVIVRHLSGNLLSRFTDFLTSDGEKPWRNRDAEFDQVNYSQAEMNECWARGWDVLEDQLGKLSEADLDRRVTIRGQELSVRQALLRSLAHTAYHVGQIVLLARVCKGEGWEWISIPRGKSEEYNRDPTLERRSQ
jgi:hypothetical protein